MEDCTGAEEAGAELASKVDSGQDIIYRKSGLGNATSALVDKTFPRLSQTKQDTTRWLPELCTAKNT